MVNATIEQMPLATAGRLLFALAMAAFGVQYVVTGGFAGGLPPVPPWTPGAPFLAYLVGVLLVVAALAVAVEREARFSAMFLGILFVACVVFLQGSRIGDIIAQGTARTRAFEPLALGGAAFVLAGMLRAGRLDAGWGSWVGILATAGRLIFAVSSIVFGVQHFMYASFLVTLIPAWIPWHLFWIELTACGFIAAGIAIGFAYSPAWRLALGPDVFLVGLAASLSSRGCRSAQRRRVGERFRGGWNVWRVVDHCRRCRPIRPPERHLMSEAHVTRSRFSFQETVTRLAQAITGAGQTTFATIDQSKAAAEAGLSLRPTTLIVFGNPKGGTPLMQGFPLVGLDLPLKLLVYEDESGVSVAYVSMSEIARRWGVTGYDAPLAAADRVLESLAASVA